MRAVAISPSSSLLVSAIVVALAACGKVPDDGDGGTDGAQGDSTGSSGQDVSTSSSVTAAGSPETSHASDGSSDASTSTESSTTAAAEEVTSSPSAETGEESGDATAMPDPSTTGANEGCGGPWPSLDPAVSGPYEVITETEVGPVAGMVEDGVAPTRFTMVRPAELGQDGRCHPVVTWGNGTGATPNLYGVVLRHLASHGFVVIASDNENVGMGDPPPMVVGVEWVLQQHEDPTSPLYQHIDVAHIGATGHSQGGFATTTAGGEAFIRTIAPLCGASGGRDLHGPAWLFCGGMDETVTCGSIERSFDAIADQPVMLANHLASDHANWITFRGTEISPVETAMVAWMRVHLMGDEALRGWFYGPSCELCTDPAWSVAQKMMD